VKNGLIVMGGPPKLKKVKSDLIIIGDLSKWKKYEECNLPSEI
jgi:hypothetical protein